MSQKIFQILNEQVTILSNNGKEYHDTVTNFEADSGLSGLPEQVLYDNLQKCCRINGVAGDYPNELYEGYISNVEQYIRAKENRLQLALTPEEKLEEARQKKLNELDDLLSRTDYQAIKYAEGQITEEQYAPVKAARETWRTSYNVAEKCESIESLNAVTYDTSIPAVDD